MTSRKLHAAAVLASAAIIAGPALGEVTDLGAAIAESASATTMRSPFDDRLGSALDDTRLSAHRGGQDVQVSDIKARANVNDNSASYLTTGTNTITEGAFGHVSGMPMVIQNSGNNVSIQNATILNLQLK